ncbi:CHC2-type zinc finger protein [Azorhizobium sp. AG788]|uniref:DUF7146 domain-containing protein n=1 Tax=Azorhizobium sp. AG788 TaxID=2183897 RepID=UPI00105B9AB4|nr:CHC2 zinc finger domain-containing protein [Azorhizobium sp. AG788]TDT94529.1 CHC2-type zinc finger protein [Azorhizobium sp. AG788]
MSGPRDPDFDAWVKAARDVSCLAVLDRRGIKLRRAGTEHVGPCPVCGGTDRFGVHARKDIWICRGSGRGGDAIALVQYLDGADFLGACETLTGRKAPRGEGTRLSPEELARRAEERRAAEAKREAQAADYRERERRHLFHEQWLKAQPAHAAPMLAGYFARRGLALPEPCKALRFLPDAPYFNGEVEDDRARKVPRLVHRGPAMLAAITDAEGVFRGLHCTWLDLAQPKGKAVIADPETGELLPAKKVRGSMKGGRILLAPAASGTPRRSVAGEGIETVAAARTALLTTSGIHADCEFAVGISLGNLTGKATETVPHPTLKRTDSLGRTRAQRVPGPQPDMESPAMFVPDTVTHLTLLADGDSDPFATRCAMERAQARHAAPGRFVTVAWPPEGLDFNDMLMEAAE